MLSTCSCPGPIPAPRREPRPILRRLGGARASVPARQGVRLQGPQAGEPAHRPRGVRQGDGLWLCQEGPEGRQDIHTLWDP